jgi:sugar/nucleoside kinase (ribokinase family)
MPSYQDMDKEFDLVVIGEINPDLILHGDDVVPEFGQAEKLIEEARLTIGSSSAIMACGAARLGLKVAFVGLVGDDEFGHFMLDSMQERGVDTSACIINQSFATGISVILSQPEDRAILTYLGTIPLLQKEQIDESMIQQARHLHLGSYFLLDAIRPDLPALFSRARENGVTTSLDTNWDPSGRWDLADMLLHVDVFFPNENEVLHISGEKHFEPALDVLAKRVPTLAVKLGAEGGLVRQGDKTITAPALAVNVADTTGAGDSFDAGFLYGYLNEYTLEESLALACACGSLSTRSAGGTTAQPTLDEAQRAMLRQSER